MTRRLLLTLAFLVTALCCAALVRANPRWVDVDLAFGSLEAPLGQALAVAVLVGWACGVVAAAGWTWRAARDRARLQRQLRLAEAEVRTLRAIAPGPATFKP